MIKIIAADMDGTLLDENSEVPEETFGLIHELHQRGIVFAASSGRRYNTLRWFFEPVKDEMDYVASLGTEVYAQGRMIGREVFSYAAIVSLLNCAPPSTVSIWPSMMTITAISWMTSPTTCGLPTRTCPMPWFVPTHPHLARASLKWASAATSRARSWT